MKKFVSITILFCLIFTSCSNKKAIYEQTVSFPNYQWNRFHIVEFSPEIKKQKKSYDFILSITYQEGYPYETLPINTVLKYPNGQKSIFKYVFLVRNEDGYIGNIEGNNRSIEATIHSDKKLPEAGIYTFAVQQLTQYYDLQNIVSVSCKVVPSSSKK